MTNPFAPIKFNARFHSYSLHGKPLTSVTKYAKRFAPEFDSDYWSKIKAAERGVSQDTILAEWKEKGDKSIIKGNAVHQHIEAVLTGRIDPDDPFLSLNDNLPECKVFDGFWRRSLSPIARSYKTEWIVGDYDLGLGGTIDSILHYSETDSYHIFDWKTNAKFNLRNAYGQKLLEPFTELDDCEWTKYSLQVSIYKLILKRNTDLNIGAAYIVHLTPDGYNLHKAIDLTDRLEAYILER